MLTKDVAAVDIGDNVHKTSKKGDVPHHISSLHSETDDKPFDVMNSRCEYITTIRPIPQ